MSLTQRVHAEEGSALIVILAVTGILSLLVTASFTTARRSIQIADEEEETHGALAAAEAGLDDYLFRLNSIDQYWSYGDPAAPDPLQRRPAPPDGNAAFTAFVPVPGGETDTNIEQVAEFTYDVDTSDLPLRGVLRITATGCAPGPCFRDPAQRSDAQRYRSIEATLRQQSFGEYLYFTEYETQPPLTYGSTADQDRANVECRVHKHDDTDGDGDRNENARSTFCVDIFWGGNDVVDGPFHTNDRFQVMGNATWRGPTSSSDPRNPPYDRRFGWETPTFESGLVHGAEPLLLPPSNSALKAEADPVLGGEGCLFTGATQIVLRANGTMDVTSPHSKSTGCSSVAFSQASPTHNLPLPDNGVVYVQAIPGAGDPNHSSNCVSGSGNRIGYPRSGDITTYNCRDGDAFVEGVLDGRLTIGAQNDVIVTWHLEYEDGTDSMLGLLPNDFAYVYHPVNSSNQNLTAAPRHSASTLQNVRIEAAILTVGGSFMVQHWNRGGSCNPLGMIHLFGSIAQVFRGPVGTGGGSGVCTGYDKDYQYDERLRFTSPPSFINPVDAIWAISRYSEQYDG